MRNKWMLAIAAAAAALVATGCGSDDSTISSDRPTVSDAWARVTTPTQSDGAVYMTIESADGDTLTGATVPASVAAEAQMHETTDTSEAQEGTMPTDSMSGSGDAHSGDAMMGMKEVDAIEVPAGGEVALEPGGYHIMLIDLAKPIEAGDTVPVTLQFENAGEVQVDAEAREE